MSIPTISPLSPAPNRQTSSRTQFAIDVDRRLSEENRLTVEANALAEWMNERAADVGQGASSVTADKQAAAVSAASAATARTQAQAAAASASDSAAAANTSRGQAQTAATSAAEDAQRAEDAADRAEAIVGPVGTAASKDVVTSNTDPTISRIPQVGWMGLGQFNNSNGVPQQADFNTDIPTCFFPAGSTAANKPPSGNATVNINFSWQQATGYGRQLSFDLVTDRLHTRRKSANDWYPWAEIWTSASQFALGATRETARAALGITDSPGRVQPENWIGNVATSAAQTVNIDVTANESSSMSMDTANTTGSLTINFTNIPNTSLGYCVWYVDILRAGRKTVNFTLPAGNTLRWAGGAVPVLSDVQGHRTQIMFEKKLGMQTVYASVVREGLFN